MELITSNEYGQSEILEHPLESISFKKNGITSQREWISHSGNKTWDLTMVTVSDLSTWSFLLIEDYSNFQYQIGYSYREKLKDWVTRHFPLWPGSFISVYVLFLSDAYTCTELSYQSETSNRMVNG